MSWLRESSQIKRSGMYSGDLLNYRQTVDDVIDLYLRQHGPNLRRVGDRKLGINILLSQFAEREIDSLKSREIIRVAHDIAVTRPVLANRELSYSRAFFGWAFSQGLVDQNPLLGVRRICKEVPRERWLSISELVLLRSVLKKFGYPFGDAADVLLLTGARISEVSKMTHQELVLDLDGEIERWALPSHRSKTGRAFHFPLSSSAKATVARAMKNSRAAGSEFLFTTNGRSNISGWSRFKRNLDTALISESKRRGRTDLFREPWRFHDLRRSLATLAIDHLGADAVLVDRCLNHCGSMTMSSVSRVYNLSNMFAQRTALVQAYADLLNP